MPPLYCNWGEAVHLAVEHEGLLLYSDDVTGLQCEGELHFTHHTWRDTYSTWKLIINLVNNRHKGISRTIFLACSSHLQFAQLSRSNSIKAPGKLTSGHWVEILFWRNITPIGVLPWIGQHSHCQGCWWEMMICEKNTVKSQFYLNTPHRNIGKTKVIRAEDSFQKNILNRKKTSASTLGKILVI